MKPYSALLHKIARNIIASGDRYEVMDKLSKILDKLSHEESNVIKAIFEKIIEESNIRAHKSNVLSDNFHRLYGIISKVKNEDFEKIRDILRNHSGSPRKDASEEDQLNRKIFDDHAELQKSYDYKITDKPKFIGPKKNRWMDDYNEWLRDMQEQQQRIDREDPKNYVTSYSPYSRW
jgi:hypothetical protein